MNIDQYKTQIANHPYFIALVEDLAKELAEKDRQTFILNLQIVHQYAQRFKKKYLLIAYLLKGIYLSPTSIIKWDCDLWNIPEVYAYITHCRPRHHERFCAFINSEAERLIKLNTPVIKQDVAA